MRVFNLERGGRPAAIATLFVMPVFCAGLVAWSIAGGEAGVFLLCDLSAVAVCAVVARVLWVGIRTWTEVTADGITWCTPGGASAHFSPSGSVAASRIAAMAITPFARTSKTGRSLENGATFAVLVQLVDGSRVVLPVASDRNSMSRSMEELLDALTVLPDVVPIDIGPLAGLPRAGARR